MHVREAVLSRYSCRAFLPTPIPEATVRAILEAASRAPSGGNLQPWRVYALAGEPLEAIKRNIAARPDELPFGEGAEYPVYPRPLKEPFMGRRHQVGEMLYGAIGVAREDKAGRYRQYAQNFQLFGAPVGLFISTDRTMGLPQWSDLGMFVQTISLLARGHGLDTCTQEAWTHWHKTLSGYLALAPEEILFCGMALGHADPAAPINQWRSPREPVESFVTFAGFES